MSCYAYVETPPPALLNICKNPTKPLPIQSTEFGPFDSLTDFPEFLSMIAATCQSTVNNLPVPSLKWKFDSEYIEGTWGEAMQGGRNDKGNEYHAMISSMTGIGSRLKILICAVSFLFISKHMLTSLAVSLFHLYTKAKQTAVE
jgi:hypothetical protein